MSTPGALRELLEAALVADPDDLAAHAAYADLLMEEGDPRGEFIHVQLALEDESKKARERELLDVHERAWLGELAPYFVENRDERSVKLMEDVNERGSTYFDNQL